MPTHQIKDIIDGQPTFEKPLASILSELKVGGALRTLSAVEYITDRQRAWYKGIALRDLVKYDENGESKDWWDTRVKQLCNGLAHLKKEIFYIEDTTGGMVPFGRLTTKGVGKRNMTAFIEEILAKAVEQGWPIGPPDPDLRSM